MRGARSGLLARLAALRAAHESRPRSVARRFSRARVYYARDIWFRTAGGGAQRRYGRRSCARRLRQRRAEAVARPGRRKDSQSRRRGDGSGRRLRGTRRSAVAMAGCRRDHAQSQGAPRGAHIPLHQWTAPAGRAGRRGSCLVRGRRPLYPIRLATRRWRAVDATPRAGRCTRPASRPPPSH